MLGVKYRNRHLLIALVPAIAISLLLGVYLITARISELKDFLIERGTASSHQLAILSAHGAQLENPGLQHALVSAAFEEESMRAVSLYDQQGKRVAHYGPQMIPGKRSENALLEQPVQYRTPNSLRFVHPIRRSDSLVTDAVSDDLIGWVELEYDFDAFTIKTYQTILFSGVLVVLVLSFCGIWGRRMHNRLSQRLQRIQQGLLQLQQGDLEHRIRMEDAGETTEVANAVDAAAAAMDAKLVSLQEHNEQTAADLRETLETIEIQNIELDLARRDAVAADRIKSQFLANTSHELRSPLNGIIGFTNLLLNAESSPRKRDYLQTIQQSSAGLLSIINDILDFSKIEAGKLSLERLNLNLRELFEEVLKLLAPSAYSKGLELALIVRSDVPDLIEGDPLRIRQMLTNLVSNAIKFTDKGSVLVQVRLDQSDTDSIKMTISVTDTGPGLTPQQRHGLFEPFNQADNTSSREHGGTGLGLSICKGLAEAMGGELGVNSTPGSGSTFWFTLTCPSDKCCYEKHEHDGLLGLRVALVEPNAASALALRQLLENRDCQVEQFDSTEQLLREYVQPRHRGTPVTDLHILALQGEQLHVDTFRQLDARIKQHSLRPTLYLYPGPNSESLDIDDGRILCKPILRRQLYTALTQLGTRQKQHPHELPQANPDHARALEGKIPRVLAVDDNPANLKLLMILLEQAGVEAVPADSGEQVVQLCREAHFDLILMDIQMPGMDGIEATRILRTSTDGPNRATPIVALTAHALADEKRRLQDAGMNDYLAKPLDTELLRHALDKWCDTSAVDDKSTDNIAALADSHSDKLVDRDICLSRVNSHSQLALQMLTKLLNALEQDRNTIVSSFKQGDMTALQDAVHELHAAACYTGVPALGTLLRKLENAVNRGEANEIAHLMPQLHQQVEALLHWRNENDIEMLFS